MAKFYIGDPGYPIEDPQVWSEMLDLYWEGENENYYTREDGVQFIMQSTGVLGDGAGPWWCDSGLYGIIRYSDIEEEGRANIEKIVAEGGADIVEIDAQDIDEMVEKGLVPAGFEMFGPEDFAVEAVWGE